MPLTAAPRLRGHQPDTPTRVVHQGDRRLDDRLPRLRILRAPRVRVRQRSRRTQRCSLGGGDGSDAFVNVATRNGVQIRTPIVRNALPLQTVDRGHQLNVRTQTGPVGTSLQNKIQ